MKIAYSKETQQNMLVSIAIYNFEKILGFLGIPQYVIQKEYLKCTIANKTD